MKQKRTNKWMTRFGSEKVKIIQIKGSMIVIETKEGQQLARDASLFKNCNQLSGSETEEEEEEKEEVKSRPQRTRKPIDRYGANGPEKVT